MKLIYTGDFERLKDFGFVKDKYNVIYTYNQNRFTGVRIEIETKRIGLYNSADIIVEKETLCVLYDLIQAGLVRKEEENE